MAEHLPARIEPTLTALSGRPRWLLGFSGGLDSTVLLDLLQQFLALRGEAGLATPALLAIHIHHGLCDSADDWQQHCRILCRQRDIPFCSVDVVVANSEGGGLEAAARQARYRAIEQLQQPGDALFLGHHLDDQLETLLLRLFRSSGIAGLAAMAEQSHQQPLRVRPLLGISRGELHSYARQRGLRWVEDGSNSDQRFSRNFIRHRLLPVIAEHWPDYRSRLAALSRSARDSSELLDEVAGQDLAAVASRDRWGQFLDLASLAGYSPPRIKNMLRAWLHQLGLPALRQRQWHAFYSDLMAASDQANPVVALVRGSLRRYRNSIYWVPENPDVAMAPLPVWNARRTLDLGAAGQLRVAPVTGAGLDRQHCFQPAFRRGGEKVRGAGWRHSKSLKQYLHEQGVPPWWRHRVPLLFCAGELAAVADFCVCEGFMAAPGGAAIQLQWHTGELPLGGV